MGRTFSKSFNHASRVEDIHLEGRNKRPMYQGRFCGSNSSSQFRGGTLYVGYPLCSSFKPQSQIS